MNRAIILGSGTSNGVPMLGVRYPEAFLANPKNHRTRCSVVLQSESGAFLIDCPPELRLQLVRERIFAIDAVLITHTHADHVMGMDDLRSFCIATKRAMPVYALPQYQDDIRRIFPYAFQEFPPGIEAPKFDLRDVPPTIVSSGFEIETMRVEHGANHVVAIRVGDFAYITDVSVIPPAAWDRLQGLQTLVLDAVRYKPHPNHLHFDAAVDVAQRLGAKQTYFTHLSHDYDHATVEASLPPEIRLAFDGLSIPVGRAQ